MNPARVMFLILAGLGIAGVLPVVYEQLTGTVSCPQLAALPACYIVLLCYSLVFLSGLSIGRYSRWLFWPGWTAIVAMAATGTAFELFGNEVCPRSDNGIPTCYFSLGISIILLGLFLLQLRPSKNLESNSKL